MQSLKRMEIQNVRISILILFTCWFISNLIFQRGNSEKHSKWLLRIGFWNKYLYFVSNAVIPNSDI